MGVITPSIKHFLSAEKFAVIGSVITDPTRWDYKVSYWALGAERSPQRSE
jgi:hypothetical protein